MYLFFGKENRVPLANEYQSSTYWGATSLTYQGVTTAPDGSSAAQIWSGDNSLWYNLRTSATNIPLVTGDNKALISSFYMKAMDPDYIRNFAFIADNVSPTTKYWGSSIYFQDYTVVSHAPTTGTAHRGTLNIGNLYVGNGWYKFWQMHDLRDFEYASPASCNLRVYINALGSAANNKRVSLWGVQLEKTRYRAYPTPLRYTDNTAIIQNDYTFVVFTQLPDNITEIENNIYESYYNIQGSMSRKSLYKDNKVYTMEWSIIDYQKHGHMLYLLRQSCVDRCNTDCILEYPPLFKRNIRSADIRVLNFSLNYLDIPNMASVTAQYAIDQVYPY